MKRIFLQLLVILAFLWGSRGVWSAEEKDAAQWGTKQMEIMESFWKKGSRFTLSIPYLDTVPGIDGKMDDECWQAASQIANLITCESAQNKPSRYGVDYGLARTEARVFYGKTHLYIFVRAHELEKAMPLLRARYNERDSPVWQDDCIEIFLDPDNAGRSYFHMIINSVGTIWDAYEKLDEGARVPRADQSWNCRGQTLASVRGDDFWTMEMAIPYETLKLTRPPQAGDTWGFNLARERHAAIQYGIGPENTSWVGCHDSFCRPEMLGALNFTSLRVVSPDMPDEPFFGKNSVAIRIRNNGEHVRNLAGYVRIVSHMGPEYATTPMDWAVPSGKEAVLTMPYEVTSCGIQYLEAHIDDSKDGKPVFCMRRGFVIDDLYQMLGETIDSAQKILERAGNNKTFTASFLPYKGQLEKLMLKIKTFRDQAVALPSDAANLKTWKEFAGEAQGLRARANFAVWTRCPWFPVSGDEFPPDFSDMEILEVKGCRNEYISRVILISNFGDDDLDCYFSGKNIPGLRDILTSLPVPLHTIMNENPAAFPDDQRFGPVTQIGEPLLKMNQMREILIPPRSTRYIWLTFFTGGMESGLHRGVLSVNALNKAYPPKKIKIEMSVWDFSIPSKPALGVHVFDYSSREDEYLDLVEHKTTHFFTSDFIPYTIDSAGNVKLQGQAKTAERIKEKLKYGKKGWAYGIVGPFIKNEEKSNVQYGSEEFIRHWKQYITALAEFWEKDVGVPIEEAPMQLADEMAGKQVDQCIAMGKIAKEVCPKIKFANTITAGLADLEKKEKANPCIDIWVQNGHSLPASDTAFFDKVRKQGDQVWTYRCRVPAYNQSPMQYFLLRGWCADKDRLDGIALFCWSRLVYRVPGVDKAITTRGWEAWRDGIEDWQYLHLLRSLAGKAEVAGKQEVAAEALRVAERAADDVLGSGKLPEENEDLYLKIESGRENIAREILKLKKVLGK